MAANTRKIFAKVNAGVGYEIFHNAKNRNYHPQSSDIVA
jgi:hypothetical protein